MDNWTAKPDIHAMMLYNSTDTPTRMGSDKLVGEGFLLAGQVYDSLLVVPTVLGASLIYASFYSNVLLRTRPNVLFLSLVTADVLMAILVMPLDAVHYTNYPAWPFSTVVCNVWNSLFVALGTSSLVNLAALSVDKLLAISKPLIYSGFITRKTRLVLGLLWLYAILNGFYCYFIWKQHDSKTCRELSVSMEHSIPLLILNVLIPYSVCLTANIKILKISREQSRKVNTVINLSEEQKKLRARKGTRTICLLVGTFSFCVLPFFLFHGIDAVTQERLSNRVQIGHIVKWLYYLNSASNWALYGLLNREFRTTFYRLFRRTKENIRRFNK